MADKKLGLTSQEIADLRRAGATEKLKSREEGADKIPSLELTHAEQTRLAKARGKQGFPPPVDPIISTDLVREARAVGEAEIEAQRAKAEERASRLRGN